MHVRRHLNIFEDLWVGDEQGVDDVIQGESRAKVMLKQNEVKEQGTVIERLRKLLGVFNEVLKYYFLCLSGISGINMCF